MNKLYAHLSWIMSILAFVLAFIMVAVSELFFEDLSLIGDALPLIMFIVVTGTGLVVGIISFKKIKRINQASGKAATIVGVILNSILFGISLLFFIILTLMEIGSPTY